MSPPPPETAERDLVASAMLQSSSFDDWLAWPGILIGALLVIGSLEFVGRFEEHGWTLAAKIVPIAYTAWSLWLLAAGVVHSHLTFSYWKHAASDLPDG